MDAGSELAGFAELVAPAIATTQVRVALGHYAQERAALHRVATLVAGATSPEHVFGTVAAEIGQVLAVDFAVMGRYDPDGAATILGTWTRSAVAVPTPVDGRVKLGGQNVTTQVYETGRPARLDSYADAFGVAADVGRAWGLRSIVGAPIGVEGRPWGVVIVAYTTHEEPLPADTEARLAGFTELVGIVLANAKAQAALTASRARIVAAADTARRRIERDLHDGAQQRLVTLALQLRAAQTAVPPAAEELADELEHVTIELSGVLAELREMARGIHPSVLADGGLRPAMAALASRSAVPVHLEVRVLGRLPEQIEVATYYVVAEALTNAAKHAQASVVHVQVEPAGDDLHICVRDDGLGGADLAAGSGLVGLKDRVEALGGRLSLRSALGTGTAVEVTLPLDEPSRPGLPR
jgi:signal transduction histidine kinase